MNRTPEPPTIAGPENWNHDLSSAFRSVESHARSSASEALSEANRFLAFHAVRLLEDGEVQSILSGRPDSSTPEADLLWLNAVEEAQRTHPANERKKYVFREALSLARPEERPLIAFVPVDGTIAGIAVPRASVELSISTLRTTGLPGLEFRDFVVEFQWDNLGVDVQRATALGSKVFYQIAAEKWLLFSAIILGVAQAAFEYAMDYSRKRITFGKAIGHHQAVALKLADIAIALESSRLLCEEACASGNTGLRLFQQAGPIWSYVKDIAKEAAPQTMQVMGGHGYLQQHPVQQWFCDLQLLAIAGELPASLAACCET